MPTYINIQNNLPAALSVNTRLASAIAHEIKNP